MGDCNCRHTMTPGGICVECDVPQLARNNYFTGKLLVERDFTDEQRYYLGKLRRHNQRLHGWGAVCGLKVCAHPNPNCQDHYLRIELGMAVDCCGREIVVANEEYFNFHDQLLANWQAQNGPNTHPGDSSMTIQICIAYKECAAEDVPAIFDDCSQNGSSCQPNRIVDGHSFDVLIRTGPPAPDPLHVKLKWDKTINLANAVAVVENDVTGRIYVLSNPKSGAVLYSVDAGNYSVLNSQTFAKNTALDVAVAPEGDFVYVASQPKTGDPVIQVVPEDLSSPINTQTVTGGAGKSVRLAVTPDNHLLAVNGAVGGLYWAPDITTASPAAPKPINAGKGSGDVAVATGNDGNFAYISNSGGNNVSAVDLTSSTLAITPVSVGTGSAVPAALAVATTSMGDDLAVLDVTNQTMYVIGMRPDPGSATQLGDPVTGFAHPASTIQFSPGGRWIYVLEEDAAKKAYIEVADEHAIELKHSPVLGGAIAVGFDAAADLAITQNGRDLYVPYAGDGGAIPGAVAVVNVIAHDCPDIFKEAIDNCPDCTQGNCIVLATISKYVYGNPVTDTMIDNLTDRHLLVSTDLLTQVVRCILDEGTGEGSTGPQGPPGLPGINGATWFEGNGAPASGLGNNNDLYLDGASGDVYQKGSSTWTKVGNIMGPQGPAGPGLETGLTRIVAISWDHASASDQNLLQIDANGTKVPGLVVAFSADVRPPTQGKFIDTHILEMTVPGSATVAGGSLPTECHVPGRIFPVKNLAFSGSKVTGAQIDQTLTSARGLAFVPGDLPKGVNLGGLIRGKDVRVYFRGDYVLDANKKAVCCEFVRAHFPTGEIPPGGNFGIEGGVFFSWFIGGAQDQKGSG